MIWVHCGKKDSQAEEDYDDHQYEEEWWPEFEFIEGGCIFSSFMEMRRKSASPFFCPKAFDLGAEEIFSTSLKTK